MPVTQYKTVGVLCLPAGRQGLRALVLVPAFSSVDTNTIPHSGTFHTAKSYELTNVLSDVAEVLSNVTKTLSDVK
ncbi:MAG: hypothetical protein JXB00_14525 [Bacteroidales bacterium]|nr:hypothetical protein [Bacteroidales bacterium]